MPQDIGVDTAEDVVCALCGRRGGPDQPQTMCRCARSVHKACMEQELTHQQTDKCGACGFQFAVQRRHRHGLLRALRRWYSDQAAGGQLAVSTLWVLVVTPVAVLSAYFVHQSVAYYRQAVAIRRVNQFWAHVVRQPTLANRVFVASALILAAYAFCLACLLAGNLWHFFSWRRATRSVIIVEQQRRRQQKTTG